MLCCETLYYMNIFKTKTKKKKTINNKILHFISWSWEKKHWFLAEISIEPVEILPLPSWLVTITALLWKLLLSKFFEFTRRSS